MYSFKYFNQISEIGEAQWQRLVDPHYPFLQYSFLEALERSQCTSEKTGWQAMHLALYRSLAGEAELIAVMPLYLKQHSYGEYVFDWAWADAYHTHGVDYYPKLLNAIPFSPCYGPRLATRETVTVLIPHFLTEIKKLCQSRNISSWHSLFHDREINEAHREHGMLTRTGCQFHWHNRNYQSFDHYLTHFNSRKRKSVKRERRKSREQGVEILCAEGAQITHTLLHAFYHCYHLTYLKRGRQGYLNLAFFEQLLQAMPQHLVMFYATLDDQIVACALCFKNTSPSQSVLYGRYWGCLDEFDSLHFETCYYVGLEYCIKHQIARFDPGAQGEHKIQRGFEPITTYSSHYIAHPQFREAIDDFLARERPTIDRYQSEARALLPFKEDN
ncbi:MAG: GNAT family N-acetyltransferase [Pseudomonadales bacterium]